MITTTLGSVRVGRANGRRVAESGALGLSFPPMPIVGFHVMMTGDGWLITSGDPVALRPGDIVFTGAGARHGIARTPCTLSSLPEATLGEVTPPPGPVDFEFLCASYPALPGQLPPVLRGLPPVVAIRPDYDRHPQLRAVVELLHDDCTSPGTGTEVYRGSLIDVLLVHILRLVEERYGLPDLPRGIAEAVRAIHADPARAWTVQRLCAVAGMSRTAFNRHFTSALGRPPMAYLTDWRLGTGARLLRETPAPLAAVARQVGYANEFAFAAAFRRRYGTPPGQYRTSQSHPLISQG